MDSYGHAFAAFAPLVAAGAKDAVLARTFESVEDILAQAEETERLLFLSTGLSSTSFVIRSAFDLAAALNKAPPAKPAQITKLARYFENNVHASHIEDVHATLTALSTLSNNAFFVPLAITPVAIRASQQSPRVSVRVTKANGDAAGVPLTVKLVRSASKPVNVALTADASDASLYSFDLVELVSASGSGVYALEISASPAGTGKQSVLCQARPKFSVSPFPAASSKAVDLKFPAAASSKFSVDFLQKIIVRFSLTDAKDQPFIAHQVFARVSNARNDVEHFVIGEHNAQTNQYQIVLDISAIAEALDAASDDYEISIIVGDAGLASAINWKIGTFAISFPDSFKATLLAARKPVSTVGGSRADFATKKEIHHIFRVPEKRPPIIVSTVFIGLVLAPAAFLLVAWGLIGANVKNMSFHPIAHVFHASIAGILLILVLFWLHLSFFTTLKYLALVGIVAAASGNHTLRRIAAAREKASQ
ncbi:hypothetical protein CAOG_01905 [Capsaspora owczarzaki ATCC 30864]|uniref:Dolichyl-diphosphooligosaccharide--protein glycosyltransferase subunit 2 n=1 Tax=Capsaspora owczarzaki (strain ATCC 30864) TaxID=595528 RepID=A0A0D2U678_CAPO3|nr:hypothetical protein CAOG_01905 [Capsaspora owczarzaki ATCC 30864]KJE90621.1 hypothetical protein CAOG_001905 [Capsaspora owczarzaki ATCC 30864]|eukprot:XP_004364773.1 hypothetical protein CAOG_01905 [Capsaspora owczarzaki ATCC 30864]